MAFARLWGGELMETVLIHVADGDGAKVALRPGGRARFGRGAPGIAVDVRLAHPGVPRLAGEIEARADHWLLSNLSTDKTYVVENPEGAGEHVKIVPGRLAAPIPFEISRVVLPAGLDFVRFSVFAPMHTHLDRTAVAAPTGEGTLTAFPLDESAKYFLVLVALCEPRLRDRSHVAIPTVEQVVARLRPLPSCADLTVAAVNFHIDYLARTKLRVKQDPVDGPKRLDTKRAALVSLALRFNLVREEHLRLLPARAGVG
ncbi:serine/threonine protein kinase [Actinoplanes oblitus]|uniref:Serine/threonine protein kinase n=1 Tax=Actinoplanes oblitus TaxID=3040509 RepID=A0ABY8W7S3_9ACTN|nr:serine/threonine protein kinase [Actinoplanes oblitus]WIM92990.1 serine/threonine protein kinase [Actinoplanes oblitus]